MLDHRTSQLTGLLLPLADRHLVLPNVAIAELIDDQDDLTVIGQADNGVEAVEMAQALRPDIVVLDVEMPVMDGIAAAKIITDEKLAMTGKDEFVVTAGKHGLLYSPIDENGWPIEQRVGRHLSSVLKSTEVFSMLHPDKAVVINNVPKYAEVQEKGLGVFFKDPAKAPSNMVAFD